MFGRTHIAVGVATSVAILRPDTIPELTAAVAGGAFGGWFCDIDLKKDYIGDGIHQDFIWLLIILIISITTDFLFGEGTCKYLTTHWNIWSMICSLLFFVISLIIFFFAEHKGFSHSILGIILLSALFEIACKPVAPAFAIGIISHVLIDLLTIRGLMLFFPFRIRISLGLCKSGGKVNTFLLIAGTTASFIMIIWFLTRILFKQ